MRARFGLQWGLCWFALAACGGSTTGTPASSTPGSGDSGTGGIVASAGGASGGIGGGAGGGFGAEGGTIGTAPGGGGSPSTGGLTAAAGAGGCPPGGLCVPPPGPVPPGPSLCGGVECAATQACCLLTMQCFDPGNSAACPTPPPDSDPNHRATCASNADCASDEYCEAGRDGLCGGVGHCQSRTNCGFGGGTSCGCDGKTYPDIQTACLAGVRLVAMGTCGSETTLGGGGSSSGTVVTLCGSDAQCPSGQHCCGITGLCYDAAHAALCALPPPGTSRACLTNADCFSDSEFCDGAGCDGPGGCRFFGSCGAVLAPVCGCDGQTYVNADCAASAGIRVASTGNCP